MFIKPEAFDELDSKKAISEQPLPEFFIRHKELLKQIYNADRTYQYSDDINAWRGGKESHEWAVKELTALKDGSVNDQYIDAIINNYCGNLSVAVPQFSHPDVTGRTFERSLLPYAAFVHKWGITRETRVEWEEKLKEIDRILSNLLHKCVFRRPWYRGKTIYRARDASIRLLQENLIWSDRDITYWEYIKRDAVAIDKESNEAIVEFFATTANELARELDVYVDWCCNMRCYSSHRPTELSFVGDNDKLTYFRIGSMFKDCFYGVLKI